jgi:hypothetical protein
MGLTCFICEKTFLSWSALNLHLKVFHSLRPTDHFVCRQEGCQREFNLLKTLRRHIFAAHKHLTTTDAADGSCSSVGDFKSVCNNERTAEDFCSEGCSVNRLYNDVTEYAKARDNQLIAASFIGKLKSHSSIPASAVDDIVNAVKEFFGGDCIKQLKDKTLDTLNKANVDVNCDNVQALMGDFDHVTNMFDGLETKYQQMKYFKKSGNYIESESYDIGNSRLDSLRVDGKVTLVPKKLTGQHIPMRHVFKKFFELPGVFEQAVTYVNKAGEGSYTDFIDGKLWKELSTGYEYRLVFPYMLYFDDFETANPLGHELEFTS